MTLVMKSRQSRRTPLVSHSSNGTAPSGAAASAQADPMQVWLDIENDLNYAGQVINCSQLQQAAVCDLQQQINQIQRRRQDNKLYLAVIGEWNSGKSTLINAFLREDRLTTSRVPTTAVATQICYGSTQDIQVFFRGRPAALSYHENRAHLWETLGKLAPGLDLSAKSERDLLTLLTADDRIAAHLDRVVITHPAAFLQEGIVLIDTPGTNSQNPRHAAITQAVVEREADAALIVIPTLNQAGLSFVEFFAELLRPFLHRCIFLITQLDTLEEEEERQRVVNNVRKQLINHLHVTEPTIYQAAPKVVVDTVVKKKTVDVEHLIWQERFVELENVLWSRLRRERSLSIAESLLQLQGKLFAQLSEHLQTNQARVMSRQAAIQRETIQDLGQFAHNQKQQVTKQLADARNEAQAGVQQSITTYRTKARAQVRAAIFAAKDESTLDRVVKQRANEILQEHAKRLASELEKATQPLPKAARKAQKAFDTEFLASYQRLQALAGKMAGNGSIGAHHEMQIAHQDVSGAALAYLTERNEQQGGLIMAGIAIAATVAALTPLTWPIIIIGGILGAFFGPGLDTQKQKVWDKFMPAIDDYFDKTQEEVERTLRSYKSELQGALNSHIEAHVQKYKQVYQALVEAQCDEQKQLETLQQTTQTTLQEITLRLAVLQQKQERIKQMRL